MRSHGMRVAAVAALVVLFTGIIFSGCECALKGIVDQAMVTVRGLQAKAEVDAKASEGYDVRVARGKWNEALQAYTAGDFTRADRLINETYSNLTNLEKVAERVFYESLDGLTVSGLLFLPPQGKGPWPTIIVNHAGFGTAGDFSDVALGIRDRGYLVFNPDYRGCGESQGTNELGGGEVDDVIAAIMYLKSRGLVEDDRIGMYGQSHGAGISLLVAERYPGVKAVVSEAGFSDAVSIYENAMAKSSDPLMKQFIDQMLPMVGGTPEEVPEEYAARTALGHAGQVQAAVLLIHGEQDPLIPVDQAYRMYEELKAAGKTVELKIYPDEAHCVVKGENRAEVWDLMFAWFEKYV